jgi:predicted transposase YdaD
VAPSRSQGKPFDAVTKALVGTRPTDWVDWLGLIGSEAEVVDADLATVTTEADRVIRVTRPDPFLLHQEFQSSYDETLPVRLLRYYVLLHERYGLPVHNAVFLLRPEADSPRLTGLLRLDAVGVARPDAEPRLTFRYDVVRVWQLSANDLVRGPLSVAPLAPIADAPESAVPQILRTLEARFFGEAPESEAKELLTATGVLLGLRYPRDLVREFVKGLGQMKESSFYQMVLDEGRAEGEAKGKAEEARNLIILLGGKRFGAATAAIVDALNDISEPERLEALASRLLEVESWEELLAAANAPQNNAS